MTQISAHGRLFGDFPPNKRPWALIWDGRLFANLRYVYKENDGSFEAAVRRLFPKLRDVQINGQMKQPGNVSMSLQPLVTDPAQLRSLAISAASVDLPAWLAGAANLELLQWWPQTDWILANNLTLARLDALPSLKSAYLFSNNIVALSEPLFKQSAGVGKSHKFLSSACNGAFPRTPVHN